MRFTFPILFLTTLLFSATAQSQVQKIYTYAGTGVAGHSGDGTAAAGAQINAPLNVLVDPTGNVYILDHGNLRVRKINTFGNIYTIAGTGVYGFSGDGSVGTSANIVPNGIALDKNNNLYISDASFDVIRKVNSAGIISTIAGIGIEGNSGNGGPANAAKLGSPYGMAFDTAGNMYIADGINHVVRKINPAGIISRFAGDDTAGYWGDDTLASVARLDSPYAVAADRRGNVYISDMLNNVIRKVDANGVITTYAGTGMHGYSGDGGPAKLATFDRTAGIAVDAIGNLFIADADNDVIRKVDTSGIITTVVGNGTPGFGGDLGNVNGCNLHTPFGVAVDAMGSIYIADANNQRIRKTYTPVGIEDVNTTAAIEVYPNPVNDKVIVAGLELSDNVGVYDITGREVTATKVATANQQAISTAHLLPGMYMLRVTAVTGTTKAVVRLVKD